MHTRSTAVRLTALEKLYDYTFSDGYAFDGHRHTTWEVNAVLEGEIAVTCESRVLALRAGDVLLVEPELFHRNRVPPGCSVRMIVLQFRTDELSTGGGARLFRLTDSGALVLEALCRELAARRADGMPEEAGSFAGAFVPLAEAFLTLTAADEIAPDYGRDHAAETYRRAVECMEAHLHESLCMDEVARACCVSVTGLKAAFRRCAGKGAAQYFRELRLREAKRLLRAGMPVREVAETLGYSSPACFTQSFCAAEDMPPREYAKRSLTASSPDKRDERRGSR